MSSTPEEKQQAATYNYYGAVGAVQHGAHSSANVQQNIGSESNALLQALREARPLLNQLPTEQRQEAIELADEVEGEIVQDKWTAAAKTYALELMTFLNAVGAGVAIELLKKKLGIE